MRRAGILVVGLMTVGSLLAISLVMAPAAAQNGRAVALGGARGVVRTANGALLEGIAVQLISPRTAIRTTVYSNQDGRYEFPVLEPGAYTLRVARPLQFKPYVKESIQIRGATSLPEIVLERVNVVGSRPGREDSRTELLPPTPEIMSQLTGSEWMMNLPGTAEEKRTIQLNCDHCHAWQQVFKARYDEAGWRIILRRMMRGGGSPLINVATSQPNAEGLAREETLAKFLARVRGPDSKDPAGIQTLPWPRGAATKVVVTEYELPRVLLAPHDVHGDSMGRIWYTAHRSPYSGVLDPRTGKVTEYRIPATRAEDTPGALPGTHRVWVDKDDVVWFSEQWDHFLTGLDGRTGKQLYRHKLTDLYELNSSGFSNFAFDDNGYAYETQDDELFKINAKTGAVQKFTFPKLIQSTYDSIVTPDGRYWSGAGENLIGLWDFKTGEYWEGAVRTFVAGGRGYLSRGAFDRDGNAWFGGSTGVIAKLDVKTKKITEYDPPVLYPDFYEVMPDKNGEIWAGSVNAGGFVRFNPKTDKWTFYQMPEPYAHNRRTWIDNSTTPVTVWYVDNNGYIARIQPLE